MAMPVSPEGGDYDAYAAQYAPNVAWRERGGPAGDPFGIVPALLPSLPPTGRELEWSDTARGLARLILILDIGGGGLRMTAEQPYGDEPLIPMPALSLPALRQAIATVAPSRLPEFFQEIQDAFIQAGDEDSTFPIRHFYQRWGAAVAIERRPSVAARLHAAEQALADPDPSVRDQAIREAAKIVQAAYREVTSG